MRAPLEENFHRLFSDEYVRFPEGIQAIINAFQWEGVVAPGKEIWLPGETHQKLYFNTEGVLGEYAGDRFQSNCQKVFKPFTFFWSESSFLLWQSCDTKLVCLKKSSIFSIDGAVLKKLTSDFGMGYFLANRLTQKNIESYRNRIQDLCLLNPKERLEKVVLENPNILNQLPRNEMAGFLGLSRSSLFRAINTMHKNGR